MQSMEEKNPIVKMSGLLKRSEFLLKHIGRTCPGYSKWAQSVEAGALPVCTASPSTEEQADLIACTFDLFGITSVIDILIASLTKSHNVHSF